jgi:DNA-binding response OmpR family regulator
VLFRSAWICSKTGAEALELFEQIHAGLLIVDATLPRGSGMEVIAAVRKTGRAPRPHIVALTHFNAPEMIRHLEQAGADKIFLKPFRLGEILEYANGVLGPGSPPGAEESPPTP